MTLKEAIKFISILFCVITTAQVIFIPTLAIINGNYILIPSRHLYRFALVAFISALPTAAFVNISRTSKKGWKIRVIIHSCLTLASVFGAIMYYGWLIHVRGFVLTGLLFMSIYVGAWLIYNHQQRKLADQLNERLNELHNE